MVRPRVLRRRDAGQCRGAGRPRADARRRRRQDVHGIVDRHVCSSPTTSMLARVLAHGRRRVAVHAEDEARLKERKHLARPRRSANASDLARCRGGAARDAAARRAARNAAGRRVHVLHVSTGDEMAFLREHKDIATVETTPNHLTLDRAGVLRAARDLRADESAGARRGASAKRSGTRCATASSTCWAQTTRRTRARKRTRPIPTRRRA